MPGVLADICPNSMHASMPSPAADASNTSKQQRSDHMLPVFDLEPLLGAQNLSGVSPFENENMVLWSRDCAQSFMSPEAANYMLRVGTYVNLFLRRGDIWAIMFQLVPRF